MSDTIQKVKLGDVASVTVGQGAPQNNEEFGKIGFPFVRAGNLYDLINGMQEKELPKISDEVAKRLKLKLFPAGSVLFAKSGMSCLKGYVYALESPCYVVNHLAVITPYNCQTNFLKYYFDFHKPNCLVKDKSYPSISISDISNIELILPTVTEQNIISDNLCRIDNLIKKRQKQIEKLDELVKSRFIEMFEYKKFKRKKWGEVFDVTTGKLDSNAMSVDGKYPFFTCSKEVLKINEYAFDQEALLLAGNNAAGKYDVKYYNGKFNAYQRTYVISLKNDGCYKLFQYQLESKLDYLQKQSLGGLTKYLTLRILSELEFIIPPIELQNKFAEFVEKVEKNKSAIKKSLSSLETLKKSLMQKYFG